MSDNITANAIKNSEKPKKNNKILLFVILAVVVLLTAVITVLLNIKFSDNKFYLDASGGVVSSVMGINEKRNGINLIYNEKGELVARTTIWEEYFCYSEGLIKVGQKSMFGDVKYGFADPIGKIVIKCQFDDVLPFSDGLAAVKKNGRWGYIDKSGNVVIDCRYDCAHAFHDGIAMVEVFFSGISYINKKGEIIMEGSPDLIPVSNFENYYAIVKNADGKSGLIDADGNMVVECDYYEISSFKDGFALVFREQFDHPYFIDRNGERLTLWYRNGEDKIELADDSVLVLFDSVLSDAKSFSEGLAAVSYQDDKYNTNDYWGFIDTEGEVIIPFIYEDAGSFSEGLAPVKSNGKWGFIDKKGNVIIPCQYDEVSQFSKGYAYALIHDKYFVIDSFGNEIYEIGSKSQYVPKTCYYNIFDTYDYENPKYVYNEFLYK